MLKIKDALNEKHFIVINGIDDDPYYTIRFWGSEKNFRFYEDSEYDIMLLEGAVSSGSFNCIDEFSSIYAESDDGSSSVTIGLNKDESGLILTVGYFEQYDGETKEGGRHGAYVVSHPYIEKEGDK